MVEKIDNQEINSYKSNLKRMRTARGMTQGELANLTGINIKSIALYEQYPKKINKASIEKILKIANSLNCTVDDLVQHEFISY